MVFTLTLCTPLITHTSPSDYETLVDTESAEARVWLVLDSPGPDGRSSPRPKKKSSLKKNPSTTREETRSTLFFSSRGTIIYAGSHATRLALMSHRSPVSESDGARVARAQVDKRGSRRARGNIRTNGTRAKREGNKKEEIKLAGARGKRGGSCTGHTKEPLPFTQLGFRNPLLSRGNWVIAPQLPTLGRKTIFRITRQRRSWFTLRNTISLKESTRGNELLACQRGPLERLTTTVH